jgi:hypothetical protein
MTLEEKDKYRLRFKVASILMVFGVLVGGIILAYFGSISGFGGIAGSVCAFASAVFGIDYYTSPKDTNKSSTSKDNSFKRNNLDIDTELGRY